MANRYRIGAVPAHFRRDDLPCETPEELRELALAYEEINRHARAHFCRKWADEMEREQQQQEAA